MAHWRRSLRAARGAATGAAIATRVGEPAGSIYHRFESRDLLLHAYGLGASSGSNGASSTRSSTTTTLIEPHARRLCTDSTGRAPYRHEDEILDELIDRS